MKKVAAFCASNSQFCDCGTAAIYRLISIRDEPVRQKAISSISKALESNKHPLTGQILKDKRLSENDIKKVIENSEREVRGELTKKYEQERKNPPYNGTPQKDDFKDVPPAPIAQTLLTLIVNLRFRLHQKTHRARLCLPAINRRRCTTFR